MGDRAKETVIIVHGTWAAPRPGKTLWYQRAEAEGAAENFVSKLDAALQERGSPARCWAHAAAQSSIFYWSGENSWIARAQAASSLADYIAKLRNQGWRHHIIAHSHGGNVVIEALPQIMAEPSFSGKIVTLGTPFMDAFSPIREKTERSDRFLISLGINVLCLILVVGFFEFLPSTLISELTGLSWLFLDSLIDLIWFAGLVILVFALGQAAKLDSFYQPRETDVQRSETLLALSCPTDEAWQVLHHLPKIDNPIAPRSNLLRFLISSVQSTAFRLREVARLQGARSFRDIGLVAKCVGAFLDLTLIFGILSLIFPTYVYLESNQRYLGFLGLIGAVTTALIFRTLLGPAFYSAFWSPFRWVARQLQSLAGIGPALGTYLVRRRSWPVLLEMVIGLEGYRFRSPPVSP